MSRPAPPIKPSPPGKGKGVQKFRRAMSPEARQKLSEKATERHAQSDGHGFGRGLQKPGERKPRQTRQTRIARRVAEAAMEEKTALDIIQVFKDGIADTQPINVRLKAAEAWIKVELDAAKIDLRADSEDNLQRSREELITMLASKFTSGPAAVMLRQQLAGTTFDDSDVIQGHIVDEDEDG